MTGFVHLFRIWRSPALKVALVYGISGLGFAGGNLLLARTLTRSDYASFSLVVALLYLGVMVAPAGADGIVNRRNIDPGLPLLQRSILTSTAVGIIVVALSTFLYLLHGALLLMLLLGIVAGGATVVASAYFQSRQRFTLSLSLSQSPNLVLGVVAVTALALGVHRSEPVFFVLVVGFLVAATYGWAKLLSEWEVGVKPAEPFLWTEAISCLGVTAASAALIQLERLMIPKVLTLEDLATFGVLAALAGAPFRVLQMSVGYTLLPRLRSAETISARRRLLRREAVLIGGVVVLAALFVWILTPRLLDWILGDRYDLPPTLVLAAIIAGVTKVLNGFAKAAVTALANARQLTLFNFFGWVALLLGAGAAALGAQWGLTGVIYGVALGWLVRAVAAVPLTAPNFRRRPFSNTAAQPPGD